MITVYLKSGTTVMVAAAVRIESSIIGEQPNFNGVVGLDCYDANDRVVGRFVLAETAGYLNDMPASDPG